MTKVDPFTNFTLGNDQFRCYDGFHNWNQVQAAPYDGRYNFPSPAYIAAHPLTAAQQAAGQTLVSLPVGQYVVEAVTPAGYEIVKEEDKNILIGDAFVAPVTAAVRPPGQHLHPARPGHAEQCQSVQPEHGRCGIPEQPDFQSRRDGIDGHFPRVRGQPAPRA